MWKTVAILVLLAVVILESCTIVALRYDLSLCGNGAPTLLLTRL